MRYDFMGVGGLAVDIALGIESLPIAEEKYPATLTGKLPGGFIANATCAAAHLGLRTAYGGWVGADADGQMLHDDFLHWGVDPAGLVRVPGQTTPFTVVVTDRRGRRSILLPGSELYEMPLTYEQTDLVREARVVYSFPRDVRWCSVLRRVTQEAGGLLALDVENAVPLSGAPLIDVIRLTDIVFIPQESIKRLKLPHPRKLVSGQQWLIMTAGAKGAYGLKDGLRKPVFERGLPVEVVDTTGAGDCFHAALIAARLDGADLDEALAFANAAAALKVQHAGARGGLPDRHAVEQMRQRHRR